MLSFIRIYCAEFRRQKQVADLGGAVAQRWATCGELRHLSPNELVHLGQVWASAFRAALEIHRSVEAAEDAGHLAVEAVLSGGKSLVPLNGVQPWQKALEMVSK